jgi:hypothetical protein
MRYIVTYSLEDVIVTSYSLPRRLYGDNSLYEGTVNRYNQDEGMVMS